MNEALRLLKIYEKEGYRFSESVKQAFLKVDRRLFVSKEYENLAYSDMPLPITGFSTVSAPHMHLIYLEELELKPGHKVLEIGFGSGILLAYLVEIVGPGNVYGVEKSPIVFDFGKSNLKRSGYLDKVKIFLMDGKNGLPDYAPYDRIAVSAAAEAVPDALIEQLNEEGIILVPLGERDQWLYKLKKKGGSLLRERLMPVSFVFLE